MTNTAILAASALLLVAYLLDIVGRRWKLPSVVLLIGTGILLRQLLDSLDLQLKWVDPIVPVIGTVGLILIVLEGALDLEVSRERLRLIASSATSTVLGFCVTIFLFALLFQFTLGFETPIAVLAAIPFAVISSAVAIPAASSLAAQPREFVIYESSLSDILGVLVFYAWLDADGSLRSFTMDLAGSGVISLAAAMAAALGIYYLINQLEGHVRFLPVIAGLICLYAVGKQLHLSPLILVLGCGLLINNPHLISWNKWMRSLHSEGYDQTLKEFKGLVAELTFAMKSFFFLLLGYWTEITQLASLRAWLIAGAGVAIVYGSRWLILRMLRQAAAAQLLWIAPRGLITVLLFLSARDSGSLHNFPLGAVMLFVLATAALTALAHRQPMAGAEPAAIPEALTSSSK
ncbi:MAG TPA: sodium:proton antiporter [Casimicrobiaceae bacterium]|nr:sodium:proton antiporter [Casimicrobiaceae bacterium]